jgi:hypothetical protein
MARSEVNQGQRYRDTEAWWPEWEVVRLYEDPLGFAHAVVASVDGAKDTKTIACSALADRRRFALSPDVGSSRDLAA